MTASVCWPIFLPPLAVRVTAGTQSNMLIKPKAQINCSLQCCSSTPLLWSGKITLAVRQCGNVDTNPGSENLLYCKNLSAGDQHNHRVKSTGEGSKVMAICLYEKGPSSRFNRWSLFKNHRSCDKLFL